MEEMAFLNRLSKTQKILLAIFCFPLLPFYFCYVCCCGSDENTTEEYKEDVEEGRSKEVNDLRARAVVDNEPNQTSESLASSSAIQRQSRDVNAKYTANRHIETVTTDIHPRLSKKFSFGKGKVTPTNEVSYDNKGFVNDQNNTQVCKENDFAYPWDESNLKSMVIDLNQFKQLDDYAKKVRARNSVETLVQDLLKGTNSDIEKLRSIWMWVTHHIEYDVDGFFNPSQRSSSADDVLRTGKGVCAGYSSLFQKMCSLAGIECQVVSGYSKGFQYKPGVKFSGSGDHAWNAVHLGGKWHLLDSTWGAGSVSSDGHHFTFRYKEFYFLTHPALFVGCHFPLEGQWQLLKPQLSLKQFEDAMYRTGTFYDFGLLSTKPESCIIKSDEKTTVTIKSSSPRLFTCTLNDEKKHSILTLKPDGMKLEVYPPEVGSHNLMIFCKDPDSDQNTYNNVCQYEIQCKAVNREMKFPNDLNNPVGPSWLSEQQGLHEPSESEPVVRTNDGRCFFAFRVENHLDLMAMLDTEEFSMTDDQRRRHVFQSRKGNRIEFRVQIPKTGLYQLNIFGKNNSEAETYNYICNYIIFCNNPKVKWPVYPLKYTSWKKDYELVEPFSGVLPANREVRFKMRVPGVSQVSVKASDVHVLSLDADGFWSGSCRTTGCVDVSVMVQERETDCTFRYILNYEVEKN